MRVASGFLAGAVTILASANVFAQATTQPFDDLSACEQWAAYDVLVASGKTDRTTRYLYMGLREPTKAEVLAWKSGQPFRREATVHLVGTQPMRTL